MGGAGSKPASKGVSCGQESRSSGGSEASAPSLPSGPSSLSSSPSAVYYPPAGKTRRRRSLGSFFGCSRGGSSRRGARAAEVSITLDDDEVLGSAGGAVFAASAAALERSRTVSNNSGTIRSRSATCECGTIAPTTFSRSSAPLSAEETRARAASIESAKAIGEEIARAVLEGQREGNGPSPFEEVRTHGQTEVQAIAYSLEGAIGLLEATTGRGAAAARELASTLRREETMRAAMFKALVHRIQTSASRGDQCAAARDYVTMCTQAVDTVTAQMPKMPPQGVWLLADDATSRRTARPARPARPALRVDGL